MYAPVGGLGFLVRKLSWYFWGGERSLDPVAEMVGPWVYAWGCTYKWCIWVGSGAVDVGVGYMHDIRVKEDTPSSFRSSLCFSILALCCRWLTPAKAITVIESIYG